jgi:hypothetical protein
MNGSAGYWFLLVGVLVLVVSCTLDEGHPPVARASATPDTIPEHDGFQTEVTLDGTESADPVDDPEGEHALSFHWRILFDEHRFEEGGESSPTPVVSFRGDLPATVELTVTDADGSSTTTQFQMRLTVF